MSAMSAMRPGVAGRAGQGPYVSLRPELERPSPDSTRIRPPLWVFLSRLAQSMRRQQCVVRGDVGQGPLVG